MKLQPEYGLEELDNKRKDDVLSMEGRFIPSEKVRNLRDRLIKFMDSHIYPIENELYKLAQSSDRWTVHPFEEKLKELAKREGLWNLFIPVCMLFSISRLFVQTPVPKVSKYLCFQVDSAARAREILISRTGSSVDGTRDLLLGAGLTNLEYGYLCEIMGRSIWAPQVFNCGAPDTGNMEVEGDFHIYLVVYIYIYVLIFPHLHI